MGTTSTKKKQAVATTHVTFLIDRSGSMTSLHAGVVDGFAQFVKEQQEIEGECRLTVIQFDDQDPAEVLIDGENVSKVEPYILKDLFQPRGMTPLYDAMARAINATEADLKKWKKAPDHVIFVTFTDGAENSSHEYQYGSLTDLVKRMEDKNGWTFVYMGATGTHDVYAQSASSGVLRSNTSGFTPTYAGTTSSYNSLSTSVKNVRTAKNASAVAGSTIGSFYTNEAGEDEKTAEGS